MENYIKLLIDNNWFTKDEAETLFTPKLKSIIDESDRPKFYTLDEKKIIFNAFSDLSPDDVKVLIIGQDPYPSENRAHGLAFSFKDNQPARDSLKNIFEKLESDLGIHNKNTNLECWKTRGVLLLNTSLTLKDGKGHVAQWKPFINLVIEKLVSQNKQLVIMLWGNPANNIKPVKYSDNPQYKNVKIIRSSHPSNLGKNKPLFNGEVPAFTDKNYTPFKDCNEFLATPIDWSTD